MKFLGFKHLFSQVPMCGCGKEIFNCECPTEIGNKMSNEIEFIITAPEEAGVDYVEDALYNALRKAGVAGFAIERVVEVVDLEEAENETPLFFPRQGEETFLVLDVNKDEG